MPQLLVAISFDMWASNVSLRGILGGVFFGLWGVHMSKLIATNSWGMEMVLGWSRFRSQIIFFDEEG